MQNEMKNFLVDLICEIHEKYNQTLLPTNEEGVEERNYRLGANFSYFDVLDLIESQLKSFGVALDNIGQITPIIGEEIKEN